MIHSPGTQAAGPCVCTFLLCPATILWMLHGSTVENNKQEYQRSPWNPWCQQSLLTFHSSSLLHQQPKVCHRTTPQAHTSGNDLHSPRHRDLPVTAGTAAAAQGVAAGGPAPGAAATGGAGRSGGLAGQALRGLCPGLRRVR